MTDDRLQSICNKKESQIPVFKKTKSLNRTGSLKLKNETRPRHSLPERSSDLTTPSSSPAKLNLRRHRSLQTLERSQHGIPDINYEHDDDDSENSFGSSCNSVCGGSRHSPFAHNGTTYSARSMKYIFHCSSNTGSEEYLTPTQRANRTIKRLRQMLADAQSELIERESEIARLTKELVELRLLKADDGDVDDDDHVNEYRSRIADDEDDIVDGTTMEMTINKNGNNNNARFMDVLHEENDVANHSDIIEQQPSTNISTDNRGASPHRAHTSPSLADSGNFDDINYTLLHNVEKDYEKLRRTYEQVKEEHNEKVAHLLNVIESANDRYYNLKPKYDEAELKLKQLENENELLKEKLSQQDELQKILLQRMYKHDGNNDSSDNSSSIINDSVLREEDNASSKPSGSSSNNMTSLLNQLAQTRNELEKMKGDKSNTNDKNTSSAWLTGEEAISLWIIGTRKAKLRNSMVVPIDKTTPNDAETTLNFLKSAVYYYLTDPNNAKNHLAAIQSILGYTNAEKENMDKALSNY